MLSENDIEKLIAPIVDRQEAINDYVIRKIALRVKEIGNLLPSDVYKLERLLKSGADIRKINQEISRLTGLQVKAIKDLIKTVAKNAYLDVKPLYDYRGIKQPAFDKNANLGRLVRAVANQTANTYVNFAKAQAFMIRDMANPKRLIPMSLSKTYYSVIDEAVQANQRGVIDYNTAMRRTMTQLVDSGIRHVEYNAESGKHYTQRLDTAVRRNLLDGVRAINQAVQDETGKEYGADGKELSVHANSAPDHEPIQGHQFTNEEYEKLQTAQPFQDLTGRHFDPIERPIGVLNCRHFAYSIICGVNKPNYTLEQLDALMEKNKEGYTDSKGRHYTLYQCTQKQRDMETDIRRAKEKQMTLETSGDTKGAEAAKAAVVKGMRNYKTFSEQCGLAPKMDKTRVAGYRP